MTIFTWPLIDFSWPKIWRRTLQKRPGMETLLHFRPTAMRLAGLLTPPCRAVPSYENVTSCPTAKAPLKTSIESQGFDSVALKGDERKKTPKCKWVETLQIRQHYFPIKSNISAGRTWGFHGVPNFKTHLNLPILSQQINNWKPSCLEMCTM